MQRLRDVKPGQLFQLALLKPFQPVAEDAPLFLKLPDQRAVKVDDLLTHIMTFNCDLLESDTKVIVRDDLKLSVSEVHL